jgi:hypothetical protein
MYLKPIISFFFTLCLVSFSIASSLYAQSTVCYNFENLELNSQYGASQGHQPGDSISLFDYPIKTSLLEFNYLNATEKGFENITVVDWQLDSADSLFSKYLFISNINLAFDFTQYATPVSQISFEFYDGGGQENISVNGQVIQIHEYIHEAPFQIAPDVFLEVHLDSFSQIPRGTILISGRIEELIIGGQEFAIDNFCITSDSLTNNCFEYLAAYPEPCDSNGQFYTEIKFESNNPPSDSFIIKGNGQNYGKFAYGQSSYKVGPIEANPNKWLEFVLADTKDSSCTNFVEVGLINCPQDTCLLYDLWAQTGVCQDSGTFNLYYGFKYSTANVNGFDIFLDGQFHSFQAFQPFADSIGYVLKNLKLSPGWHKLSICANDSPNCCAYYEFEVLDCQSPCRISDITTIASDCLEDSTQNVTIDFKHEALTGDFFDAYINGQKFASLSLKELPITLEGLKLSGYRNIVEICAYQSSTPSTTDVISCCVSQEFEAVTCIDSTTCNLGQIYDVRSYCQSDGSFILEFQLDHQPTQDSLILVMIDSIFQDYITYNPSGHYKIEQLQLGAGFHSLAVCSSFDCCTETFFEAPICGDSIECSIEMTFIEAHPCDANGNFLVDFGIKANNLKAARFQVYGNGQYYGAFETGQDVYTIGPIHKMDSIGLYEFIIEDIEDPNCKGFTQLVPPNCATDTTNCSLRSLEIEGMECNTNGKIDIKINLDYNIPYPVSFNVFIDSQYYETYGYHQLPLVLNNLDLPAGLHKISICDNISPNCCISTFVETPECGDCAISNVSALATACKDEDFFFVDLKFDVTNPSSNLFRVVGNNQLYGVFPYGQESYRIGPLNGDDSTFYEFIVQDINNEACASFTELEKLVNCETSFVWPGDANFDNVANNFDLLNIGIAFGTTGESRKMNIPDSITNSLFWEAQIANDWDSSFVSGLNYKHADCNGDGIVNEEDAMAIKENYAFSHGPQKSTNLSFGDKNDPALYIDFPALTDIEVGKEFKAPIIFGSNDIPAKAYGLAFTLKFDPELISKGRIEFAESWMGTPNQDLLSINQNYLSDGIIEVALTKTNKVNPFGAGPIGNFIVIIDNIEGFTGESELEIQKVRALDKDGHLLGVHTPKITLSALTEVTDNKDIKDLINVYPNPTSEYISIDKKGLQSIENVEIHSISGKLLRSINPQHISNINVSDLIDGIYIIEIKTAEKSYYQKFVKE